MDKGLLLTCLNKDWYVANKGKLSPSFFRGELGKVYEIIKDCHDKYEGDLTIDEVVALWRANNPAIPQVQRLNMEELFYDIKRETPFKDTIATTVINDMWQQEIARRIAELSVAMATEGCNNLSAIRRIVEEYDSLIPSDDVDYGPMEYDDVLDLFDERVGWKFNLRSLNRTIGDLCAGDFVIIAARPDVGKTALPISLACAPDGWCWQGAKVHIAANEEVHDRHKLRAMCAGSQLTKDELSIKKEIGRAEWNKIKGNIFPFNASGWSIDKLDSYCKTHSPDILVIDQLDKVEVSGAFTRTDEALGKAYLEAREIGKRHNCVVIGLSQLSAEAEGRLDVHHSMLAGSKTSKAAEADLILCVGARTPGSAEGNDDLRQINITKNKLTGDYSGIICQLDRYRSTYRD